MHQELGIDTREISKEELKEIEPWSLRGRTILAIVTTTYCGCAALRIDMEYRMFSAAQTPSMNLSDVHRIREVGAGRGK